MKRFALSLALAACLSMPVALAAQSGEAVDLTDAQIMDLDIIMRLYAPDLEKYKTWTPPQARKL